MFFRKKNYHASIIDNLTISRYQSVTGGVCYGMAAVGLQAILLRDTNAYDQRIECLYDMPSLGIQYHIDAAQETWTGILTGIKKKLEHEQDKPDYQRKLDSEIQLAWTKLDKKTKILISVPGFFDSIAVHQSPDLYRYLFTKDQQTYNQELVNTETLLAPEGLVKKGGITQIDGFCGAYTIKEMHQLLVSLRSQLTTAHIQFPVGLILCSHNHAFTIGLDPAKKKWMLIEANNGPTQYHGDYSLAKKINSLFSYNRITVFDTKIFTTADNHHIASELITKWMATPNFTGSHQVTADRVAYADSDYTTLLYVAAQNGRLDTVKQLIANGADVNAVSLNTPSPLYIAAYCGHAEVVKELLKNNAYVYADYHTGISPLVAAAQCRHIEIVKILLDNGGKLFEIIRDKEVIKLLREYKNKNPDEAGIKGPALTG